MSSWQKTVAVAVDIWQKVLKDRLSSALITPSICAIAADIEDTLFNEILRRD